MLPAEHSIDDNGTHQHTDCTNHEMHTGEIEGGFGAGEISKAVIHDERANDGCEAH